MNRATATRAPLSPQPREPAPDLDPEPAEDRRTQRRRMAAVWAAAGSALAAMVAVTWYGVARNGGQPPGGDMNAHAAVAEWLRTQQWWDWRGWSDWFYGGQALGVHYPPLGHALIRFTHPGHGQMAAVAVGLLVLLPWGTWRLARAVGFGPRGQRGATGAVLALAALSGGMHWILPGFHQAVTHFGSWPRMVAIVLGLFCAAWAARGERPLACGAVAGIAALFNVAVLPGAALACLVLVSTSGVSPGRSARWCLTAGTSALAVCSWWLVPFVAGLDRLVLWEASLGAALTNSGTWGLIVTVAVGVSAAWAARTGSRPALRLAGAAAATLLAALLGDQLDFPRSDYWLTPALLAAAMAVGGVLGANFGSGEPAPPGRVWRLCFGVSAVGLAVIIRHYEVLPLAAWLLWPGRGHGSPRAWLAAGAVAWFGILSLVPLWAQVRYWTDPPPAPAVPLEEAATQGGAAGLVHLDEFAGHRAGGISRCAWPRPWRIAAATGGRVRPLAGLFRESSHAAEFIGADSNLLLGGSGSLRPHWHDAWLDLGGPALDTTAAAEALGARWYASCNPDGSTSLSDVPGRAAVGVTVTRHAGEEAWHRDAVEWWIIEAGRLPDGGHAAVPILAGGGSGSHPSEQAATGVTLHAQQDRLIVRAESAGWVWVRVPWDPDWRSVGGGPVHKGGPGHLVVWAEAGETELRWSVPRSVDITVVAITVTAALSALTLVAIERRRARRATT